MIPPSLATGLRIYLQRLSVFFFSVRGNKLKTYRRINDIPVLVDRVLPSPEPHSLNNSQHTRLLPRRRPALKLLGLHQFALGGKHSLFDPAGLDIGARRRREPAERPLADAIGRIDAGAVGGLEEVLADDVYNALARLRQVAQGVLRGVEAARVADDEDGRVVVDDLGVGEGG